MQCSPLSNDQLDAFHADGFLACAGFFDEPARRRLRDWVVEVSQWNTPGEWAHYHETTAHGPVLARTERFLSSHTGLREMLAEGPLIRAMQQLFGEAACVFKDKINYKYPGGAGFHAHQDAAAYGRFGSLHITCLVAVDENTIANGCLQFAPGQHTRGLLAVDCAGCLPAELADSMQWVAAPVEPGGVLFFSSFAPHKSGPNNSEQPRRSLYITYGKASEGNLRDAYYENRSQVMQSQQAAAARGENRISTIGHFQGKGVEQ